MTKQKNPEGLAITDVRYALLATLAQGPSNIRRINGHWDRDGVVWRTYDQMIKTGLVSESKDCVYTLTEAGQAAYDNAFYEREQRRRDEIFLLCENYGSMRLAAGYADFGVLKPAFVKALGKAAEQWFGSAEGGGRRAEDKAWIARKAASIVARAERAKTVEALDAIGEELYKSDRDGWLWGAQVYADRIRLVAA